jgi:hypothetical protein
MVMMLLHTGFSGGLVTVAGGVLPTAALPFRPTTPHAIPMLVAFILSGFLFIYKGLSFIPALWPILRDLPGGWICILTHDNRKHEPENFSTVYAEERLANEDDDFYLDEWENLERLQNVFVGTLNSKITKGSAHDNLYQRAKAAVESTVGKTYNSWYGQVRLGHLSQVVRPEFRYRTFVLTQLLRIDSLFFPLCLNCGTWITGGCSADGCAAYRNTRAGSFSDVSRSQCRRRRPACAAVV